MSAADLPAALARRDLSPKVRAFLLDVQRQAARRDLTPRQRQAVARIAGAPPLPDFAAINRAARQRAEDVCRRLLPGGVRYGAEWVCGDLSGAAGRSLRVHLAGGGERAGRWIDHATGERGGDFVSLAAAVAKLPQAEAACKLARMLGMDVGEAAR